MRVRPEDRQIDCLRDIGAALRNEHNQLWTMRNGYAHAPPLVWASITRTLDAMSVDERDSLRDRLRVGLQWHAEVTGGIAPGLLVSQVFCWLSRGLHAHREHPMAGLRDACARGRLRSDPVGYHSQYDRTASNVVYLTRVRGCALLDETAWIDGAIRRALKMVAG